MLKELKQAKQMFYRQHIKYPNAIVMKSKALEELRLELGGRSFSAARVNGCVVYVDDNIKDPFEFVFKDELAPDD